MKKFMLSLLAITLISSPVTAKPIRHHHRPAPAKIIHHHKSHHNEPLAFVAAGVLGFALGNIISYSSGQTNYTVTTNDKECFLVVSKSSGNVTQRCVDGDNQVLYVD